ncbi:hypothetical protein TRVL_04010 [Trypanosoma vivax]|nr:hypothetical protein TRVL_04010 [Trypanosoma vivax]
MRVRAGGQHCGAQRAKADAQERKGEVGEQKERMKATGASTKHIVALCLLKRNEQGLRGNQKKAMSERKGDTASEMASPRHAARKCIGLGTGGRVRWHKRHHLDEELSKYVRGPQQAARGIDE